MLGDKIRLDVEKTYYREMQINVKNSNYRSRFLNYLDGFKVTPEDRPTLLH